MSPGHCGTVGIVPPKYLAQVGDAGFAVKPVGTGPYKFVEWVKDDRLVLEANKDYHRGAPAIDRLVFRPVPELTTRVAALVSGQADLVSDIPPDQTGKIQQSGNAHVEISTLGGFVIMVKMTNYLMPGPWTDVRVRHRHGHHHQDRARGLWNGPGRAPREGSLRLQPQHQVVRLRS
jgi:peptide/nickel transport system substrate-binding protein